MKVTYSSNNSGGSWWLADEDWLALEKAGWKIEWYADREGRLVKQDRFLGALASYAVRENVASIGEAIEEWESITGEFASALGCSCCGPPHNFTLYDDNDNYVDSWSPSYPMYGDRDF